MKKYPSIGQFREVIRRVREVHDYKGRDDNGDTVYEHSSDYPKLQFNGTVKLHGTNSAIVRYSDGRTAYQSRERELALDSDNSAFMNTMVNKDLEFLFSNFTFSDYCAVYGEWCGGSIQKGVALNQLDKMFVIFGVKVDDEWVELPYDLQHNSQSIYNIQQFPQFSIEIDFNKPELSQNALIEMTLSVEECCPVGNYFNVTGVGEGIVFTCTTNQELKFKSKGEKHSVSKVKVLNSVNVEELNSINEFIDMAVTENRLQQGIAVLKENGILIEPKNTGEFLRWVVTDILKEEGNTIRDNGLDEKKVKAAITLKARSYFINY